MVPKVVVSNNSQLLRHMTSTPFRRMGIDVHVVSSGEEAVSTIVESDAKLAILDAELPVLSGYDVAFRIKETGSNCKLVLVLGKKINAAQMRRVTESRCEEVLIAPMGADELLDVVAIQLGLPRRGDDRFDTDVRVSTRDRSVDMVGRMTNLSVDGARLILPQPIAENATIQLTIQPRQSVQSPLQIPARVIWVEAGEEETIVGAAFEPIDDATRSILLRLTQWELLQQTDRIRAVVKGSITEATNFADLLPAMVGRVDFDLSQIDYMNSLGVLAWVDFLENAPIQGYELHACSVPFVLQASLSDAVLGRGTITSFFAPYVCESCDLQEERLLQSATVLASEGREAPSFACPASCGGHFVLDDLPERYMAFLQARNNRL